MEKIHLENKNSLEDTLKQLIDLIKSINDPLVSGIGIGVPSVVDLAYGIVYNVVNIPSWKEVHLKDILEKQFEVPVFINNDSNCFALGEKHFGAGKNHRNLIGITIGTGIGAGIIINDSLYYGANCGAGEIGYLPYLDQNFEYYCSSNFFDKIHHTTAYETFLKAEKNDKHALAIWNEFGQNMGAAIKAVLYAYDPEVIVLGGSISAAYKYFKPQMYKSMGDSLFPKSIAKLEILISETAHVSMLGAAALVIQHEETPVQ